LSLQFIKKEYISQLTKIILVNYFFVETTMNTDSYDYDEFEDEDEDDYNQGDHDEFEDDDDWY